MVFQVQPGVSMKYIAGGDIPKLGLAVQYDSVEGQVVVGTADSVRFAGVIAAIGLGEKSGVKGDIVSVINDGVMEVIASGAVEYGDALALAADGKFKSSPVDLTPTAAGAFQIVGRAQESAADGETFNALIFVRK